jgi:hypothetical protein
LPFNVVLGYTIRNFQANQKGLKLNGTHQLLVYADDVNVLGGSVHTTKKNTEASVVASNDTGLEINAEETKNMVVSRYQNAGRSHNIKTDNKSCENVKTVQIFGNNPNESKSHSGSK